MYASIHFISGLPRCGSTLLAALLRQNPRFHAGMSGPLAGMFRALLGKTGERNEFAVFLHDFDQVEYDVTEFDRRADTPGLQTVRGKVHAAPRKTLLPPDLFQRFANDAFWRDPNRLPKDVHIV